VDTFYEVSLVVAIASAVVAILSSLLGLAVANVRLSPAALVWKTLLSHRLANGAFALGVISLAFSVVIHSRWGHGPGTIAPMDFSQLLSEHEAFATVATMLLLALILAFFRKRREQSGNRA
jgi:hypothetical protein